LLKTTIKIIAIKGTGSKEKKPKSYHPFTPLIFVPKKKRPIKDMRAKTYKPKTK